MGKLIVLVGMVVVAGFVAMGEKDRAQFWKKGFSFKA